MTSFRPLSPEPLTERPWSLEEAFQYCERLASTHYENFPVGSRFIPRKLRPYVHSIYAFARIADDFADEPQYLDNLRLAFLENWEGQLLQCMWRKPQHPVFIALQETIRKFDLPVGLFQDLLTAFKMDVTTKRHDRFIGLHFMNPVPIMKLLEVVRPEITSPETYAAARAFGESLGKTLVTAKDTPGFIVNLLLVPYLCEAVRAVEHGLSTKEDIDAAMKLGCGMPMGPLELLDFVGLDTTLYIMDILFDQFHDTRFAAPTLLRRMVAAGRVGKKAGRGFYEYPPK